MILKRETKYSGFLNVDKITLKTQTGLRVTRDIVVRKNAVAAIVYNTLTDKYIFVNQFRVGILSEILEIPAGLIDDENENLDECIRREIKEEIGYLVDELTLIDKFYISPAGSTEIIYIYFARVSQKVEEGGGLLNEGEEIQIIEMSKDEMINTQFQDLKTKFAVEWIRFNHRQPIGNLNI